MKRKIIALISAFALSFSVFAFSVSAVDEVGDSDTDGDIIATDPYVEPTDPYVEPEPEPTDEPPYVEPTDPYVEPEPTEPPYEEPTDPYVEPTYETPPYDIPDYTPEETEEYIGGGQTTYTVPETTAPPAQLYSVNKNSIDDKTLSKNDWNEISENLKNASADDSDGDDFGFIKKNTSTNDNGEWMLFLGIACLLLGLAGITYFIVATIKSRNRYKLASAGSANAKARSSKFDTADVKLPKRASNGTKKPKH